MVLEKNLEIIDGLEKAFLAQEEGIKMAYRH